MVYLDNAATTKPSESAVKAMIKAAECFGNPSSLYKLGIESEKIINKSRDIIASMLSVDAKNIYFTSGGTEANNAAVFGEAYGRRKLGNHVITSKIEHPSVLESFKRLEKDGFDVTYVGADIDGRINTDELFGVLDSETTLVSIMHVNNETGVIQPIEKIKEEMRRKSPNAVLHCDCVQSFGKIGVKPLKWGADLISISAHKIHGFKGTGALYVNDTKFRPLIVGGEQQKSVRPGTENVGGIASFGAAAQECTCDNSKLLRLRSQMKELLLKNIDGVTVNGSEKFNSGSVLSVSFDKIKAEILLHALEAHEVYVSTGSACSSHRPQPSHVLAAMGIEKSKIGTTVRISFDNALTEEEIEFAASAIGKEVETIRRYVR